MFVVCAAQLGVGIYLFQLDAIDEVDTIVGKQWNKASVSQVTHTHTPNDVKKREAVMKTKVQGEDRECVCVAIHMCMYMRVRMIRYYYLMRLFPL